MSSQTKLNLEEKVFIFLTKESSDGNSSKGIYRTGTPSLGPHHPCLKSAV